VDWKFVLLLLLLLADLVDDQKKKKEKKGESGLAGRSTFWQRLIVY